MVRGDSLYSVGELIFYGRTGVCEVKEITTLKSMGETEGRLYYILEPLYKECKISIPVDNDKIYMRPVISRKHAEELIDRIPHINTSAYYSHNLNQLKEKQEFQNSRDGVGDIQCARLHLVITRFAELEPGLTCSEAADSPSIK